MDAVPNAGMAWKHEQHVQDVTDWIDAGKYEEAEELTRELLEQIPKNVCHTRLALYELLIQCPHHRWQTNELEDALRNAEWAIGAKDLSPEAKMRAYHVRMHAISGKSRQGEEPHEFHALRLAEETLTDEKSNSRDRAWAHALICHLELSSEEERQHLMRLFQLPREVRGDYATFLACCSVRPGTHWCLECKQLSQALEEQTTTPLYRTQLLVAAIHALLFGLLSCEDEASQQMWHEQHVEEFTACCVEINLAPYAKLERAFMHLALATYAGKCGDLATAYQNLAIAAAMEDILQNNCLNKRTEQVTNFLGYMEEKFSADDTDDDGNNTDDGKDREDREDEEPDK